MIFLLLWNEIKSDQLKMRKESVEMVGSINHLSWPHIEMNII